MCISENTLNQCLKRLGYHNKLTTHGIRATISTALNELGYSKKWIDARLSHADSNWVQRTYNHESYVEQRRTMIQEWADRLEQWEAAYVMQSRASKQLIKSTYRHQQQLTHHCLTKRQTYQQT